jgi:hypothetical protein
MLKLKLTTYNTLLGGLETANRYTWDIAHFFYFILGTPLFLKRNTRKLFRTLRFSIKESPDIVVLTEILIHGDRKHTKRFLKRNGHKTVCSGASKYFRNKKMEMCVIVGSKFKARPFQLPKAFINSTWGSCAVYVQKLNTVVIGVHLSVFGRERKAELLLLKEIVTQELLKKRRVIIAGDFNTHPNEILMHLSDAKPTSLNIPTLSHWLVPQRVVDNVIIFGGTHACTHTEADTSDHKKLCSEIELG